MIFRLHGVFLAYLAMTMAWNYAASRRVDNERSLPWERLILWPVLAGLTVVLLHDRVSPEGGPWLILPWISHLFPLVFMAALAQNVMAIMRRGAQLSDIPIVIFNVGLGGCLLVADLALAGVPLGRTETSLLYSHSVVQGLLGTRLAHLWTLSWHLPLCVRRGQATSLAGAAAGLIPAALGGFVVIMLVALHGEAGKILDSFGEEQRVATLRSDLDVGIMVRADVPLDGPAAPGQLEVWRLPADHPGTGLIRRHQDRPLVLELAPPLSWYGEPPSQDMAEQAFLEGASRLSQTLRPSLLLPFPEPDGEATLYFSPSTDWRRLLSEAAERVARVSPQTRLGLRLASTGPYSRRVFEALAAAPSPVAVMGPRLEPGGAAAGRAGHAEASLQAWAEWRGTLSEPPEFWVLGASASPLAYGEIAQERFLEGCLARASADPTLRGFMIIGWRDVGHTLGLLRPDGRPRWAAQRFEQLLGPSPVDADR
ncbi:MAG: hypothetical protein ACI9EF_000274 [Pseudohongiellaceae bacterium]|jgi:hypothetical protein